MTRNRESTPEEELDYEPGFEPPRMVSWFHPVEITRTAIMALLAKVITGYADPRDSQHGDATVPDPLTGKGEPFIDLSKDPGEEFWFDFVADVGEGFDSTYTMATLLARPKLSVEGVERTLPRGQLLVMGGDMIYPFPTERGYRDRLLRPFRWALQRVDPHDRAPTLAAIPGNHDWYDGLNNFLKLFCRGRWIGGWKTRQGRSYFAARLPYDWWVWGNDIQLEHHVDRTQIEYFRHLALTTARKKNVVLCTSRAAWLSDPPGPSDTKKALRYFEEWALRHPRSKEKQKKGAKLPLVLTGDLHFYTRYQRADGRRQRIIAGGGGAYIRGTHDLPDQVELEERLGPDTRSVTYDRSGFRYPDALTSRRLASRALLFPFLRPNFWYCVGVGVLLAVMAGSVEWASRRDGGVGLISLLALSATRVVDLFRSDWMAGLRGIVQEILNHGSFLGRLALRHPTIVILPILALTGTALFTAVANRGPRRWTKWLVGLIHGVAGLCLSFALFWTLSYAIDVGLNPGSDFWTTVSVLGGLVLFGGFGAGGLMGAYLVVTNRLYGWHNNEVFACQAIPDYRSFLRIHVQKDELTVYPIGVETVPKQWRRRRPGEPPKDEVDEVDEVTSATPDLEPTEKPIRAHLIEGPLKYRDGGWK